MTYGQEQGKLQARKASCCPTTYDAGSQLGKHPERAIPKQPQLISDSHRPPDQSIIEFFFFFFVIKMDRRHDHASNP